MITEKSRKSCLLFQLYSSIFSPYHRGETGRRGKAGGGWFFYFATTLVLAAGCSLSAQQQPESGAGPLTGTAWELVRFESGDGKVSTPQDSSKYTLQFGADGNVAVRLDCNRGRGTWKSAGPAQITLGRLALTRAMCLQPSMHDTVVKQWSNIRSYVIRDQHLFLSLMADGGVFEFRPTAAEASPLRSPVSSNGPVTFTCADGESFRATFYQTEPGMVLLERGNATRPAFQVRSGSGIWYVGDSVQFREARGEATLEWTGTKLTCKAR